MANHHIGIEADESGRVTGVAATEFMERHDDHVSTTKLEARVRELEDALLWVIHTVHQAHHDGELPACQKVTCRHAREVLEAKEGR